MYNRAILMGRICNDLEVKTVSDVPVVLFRLAVERSYQPKGEERKTDFFNVVAWRTNAEFISRFFSKGRMILVEGELQTRQYTNKDGVDVNITELVVSRATFTGERKEENPAQPTYQQPQPAVSQPTQPTYQQPQPTAYQPQQPTVSPPQQTVGQPQGGYGPYPFY